jgi:hypothetical protein
MKTEKLKNLLAKLKKESNGNITFKIEFENNYRSWETIGIEDLISEEELVEKVNSFIKMGANLEGRYDEGEFEGGEDLNEFIFDDGYLYVHTCDAEEPKEKYHKLSLYFEAPANIIENSDFASKVNSGEIVAVYLINRAIKIDLKRL